MTAPAQHPEFSDDALARMGRLINQVATLDIKGRGVVSLLHEAIGSTARFGLAMDAARQMVETVKPGDRVLFATGFPVRPWIDGTIGETDGPPGVTALCRALSTGFGAVPVVTTPADMRAQVEQTLRAAAVLPLDFESAQRAVTRPRPTCVAVVVDYPTNSAMAEQAAQSTLERYAPVLLAAVEHPGANAAGVYHSSVGVDISAGVAKVEPLFALARARGLPTLTFADNVNEVGGGAFLELAHQRIPFARACVCPCGGGMAASSRVDRAVVGATANWAAYATVAALAVLVGQPRLAVSRGHDARAIEAVMTAGGVEGVSGSIWPEDGVDGISTLISGHVVDFLAAIVANAAHYQVGKPF